MMGGVERRADHAWLYVVAALYGLTFWYHPAHDPDLGWHLVGGAWIAEHHAVPQKDFINSFNPYWHDYHWLAQLAIYGVYRLGGYEGLRLALGLLMAGTSMLVLDIILLSSPRRQPATLILGCFLGAVTLIGHVASVRPQMLALGLFALALRRLIQPAIAWELLYLFLLAALLANIHVYWVLIPFLWFLYRCAPRFTGRETFSAVYAWGGLGMLAAAGLISPYGVVRYGSAPPFVWMNYALLWDYLTMPAELKATIGEFRGALGTEGFTPWLMLLYLMVVARTFRWRRFIAQIGAGLSAIVFPLLTIGSLKFVSVYAVAVLPYFVRQLGMVLRPWLPQVRRWEHAIGGALLAVVVVAAAVDATWHFPWLENNNDYIYSMQPVAACRQIAGLGFTPRPPRDHIRVLTHFNHGGWCRWILYQERPDLDFRVTTDGRTQGIPAERFLTAYDLLNVKNDWLQTLARWDPDVLVIPTTHALGNVLLLDPNGYKLVFRDENFLVFVPVR
jgi:hypothetical protein